MNPRVSSAFIAMPLILMVIVFGKVYMAVVLLILGVLGIREFYNIAKSSGYEPVIQIGIIGVIAFIASSYFDIEQGTSFVVVCVVILSLVWQTTILKGKDIISNSAITVLGALYIGLPMGAAFSMRYINGKSAGLGYFLTTIITVWGTDTSAYYGGRALGKRKLAPIISPNKTWEGAIIGFISGVSLGVTIRSLGAKMLWWPSISIYHNIIIAILTSITGQIGDLVESAFKRGAEIKDSGVFMPGHGGVLDRLDSLLLAIPVVYYYIRFFFVK